MNTGVYRIRNLVNGKCYIGSCSHNQGFKLRWGNHRRSLRKGNHHSIILQNAWNKYGELNFVFEILETCEPIKCIEREQYYLDTLHPKYNILSIAGSPLGRKASSETIQKLKNRSYDWMKGDKNWNKSPEKREFYRKIFNSKKMHSLMTPETFQKISEFHKGKPKSEIQKQRMSTASLGKPKSQKHIEKLKEWVKNNNSGEKAYFHTHKFVFKGENSPGFSGYYRFKNIVTGEELICSKIEMSKKYNIPHTKVCSICNGKRKSCYKWICVGKEESYEPKI